MEKKYDVFISYSWDDLTIASEIYDAITMAGMTCCLDRETIRGGSDFPKVVAENICNSDIFLYLGSQNSFTSSWAPDEVAFAKSHKKREKLLYYGIDDAKMPDWMDLAFGAINRRHISEHPIHSVLIKDIKTLLGNGNIGDREKINEIQGDSWTLKLGDCLLEMVRVEGGKLEIGATPEQRPYSDDKEIPAHEITVGTFYISKYLITQDIWELIMAYNKSHFKNKTCPVETLDYNNAQSFVSKLSKKSHFPFSLPTEEEWEYAARGGKLSKGYIYAGSNNIDEVAWHKFNSGGQTHPVGLKKPNELGIYDMSGNVWEWTETPMHWYSDGGVDEESSVMVRRGGSWWHEPTNCRVSKRYASDKSKKTSGLGLRVVIRITES